MDDRGILSGVGVPPFFFFLYRRYSGPINSDIRNRGIGR